MWIVCILRRGHRTKIYLFRGFRWRVLGEWMSVRVRAQAKVHNWYVTEKKIRRLSVVCASAGMWGVRLSSPVANFELATGTRIIPINHIHIFFSVSLSVDGRLAAWKVSKWTGCPMRPRRHVVQVYSGQRSFIAPVAPRNVSIFSKFRSIDKVFRARSTSASHAKSKWCSATAKMLFTACGTLFRKTDNDGAPWNHVSLRLLQMKHENNGKSGKCCWSCKCGREKIESNKCF